MSKKSSSGLGRGLGDLLLDNAPEVKHSGTVIRKDADGEVSISNTDIRDIDGIEVINAKNGAYSEPSVHRLVTPIVTEDSGEVSTEATVIIKEEKSADTEVEHRRTSLKAVFRNFK